MVWLKQTNWTGSYGPVIIFRSQELLSLALFLGKKQAHNVPYTLTVSGES